MVHVVDSILEREFKIKGFADKEDTHTEALEDHVYIVHYNVATWIPKDQKEYDDAKFLLGFKDKTLADNPDYNPEFSGFLVGDYYSNTIDDLMNLICLGKASELRIAYDNVIAGADYSPLDILAESMPQVLDKYYMQLPYKRMSLRQLTNSSNTEFKIESVEKDPNAYQAFYNSVRIKPYTKFYPTNPPLDMIYSLLDLYNMSDLKYTDAPTDLKKWGLTRDENPGMSVQGTGAPVRHIEEDSLQVAQLTGKIRVNGIEFHLEDLRMFYNTQFYDLIVSLTTFTTEINKDIDLPYIRLADLRLVRDFLSGRIMIQTLTDNLSSQGIKFLSGSRSLLQLSELNLIRLMLNSIFSFGVPFRQQLSNRTNIYDFNTNIPRWIEFLEIMGV